MIAAVRATRTTRDERRRESGRKAGDVNETLQPIFAALVNGQTVTIGEIATLYPYPDGTLTARLSGNGLMGPTERPSVAGVRRLLAWVNAEREAAPVVAVVSLDIAAWLDPNGGLRKAGLMQVAT